jgi:CDP-paratose 2-epimerase
VTPGVVEWFEVGEDARVERVLGELRELGVERLRTGISWADWHRPGGPEWYDRLLPRLAREVELLPCILYTPPSIAVAPRSSAPPRRLRDFADFVDTVIERHGRTFEYVELWNEPNNPAEWDWTLDAQWLGFCEMIGDAAHWARRRGKKTVLGGMSPIDPNWLALLGERGLLEHLDVVGVHGFPGTWEAGWDGWAAELASVREVLDRHDSTADVWITETGFSTWRGGEFAQVEAYLRAVTAPAGRVYWYAAEDLAPDRPAVDRFHEDEREYHFGLHDAHGEPKLLGRLLRDGIERVRTVAAAAGERPRARRRDGDRTAVITGGAGFVGTNVARQLLAEGRRVVIVDNLARRGVEDNLLLLRALHGAAVEVRVADIRDRFALRDALRRADEVYHLAAQVAVTTSLQRPVRDFATNAEGTIALLEEVRRLPDPPAVLFTSTNKVYGSLADLELRRDGSQWQPVDPVVAATGVSEGRPLDFCTPYGCSKGAADQYVLDYAKSFGLRAVVFRMSCIYGPYQHGTEDQGWVAHFLRRAVAGKPVTIYGDGRQVRDVLFVDDLVDAMRLALADADRLAGRAFNVGGGPHNAVSLRQVVELIGDLLGERPEVRFDDERPGDQRWYVSDTSALTAETGWEPQTAVHDGLEALHAWLRPAARRRAATAARAH